MGRVIRLKRREPTPPAILHPQPAPITATYRVEFFAQNPTLRIAASDWPFDGEPTAAQLRTLLRTINASLQPDGANAMVTFVQHGVPPLVYRGRVVRNVSARRGSDVLCDVTLPEVPPIAWETIQAERAEHQKADALATLRARRQPTKEKP